MTDADIDAIVRKLTPAQREAIYPGPGNPEYARGAWATMTVLKRLDLVKTAPRYGGSLLTEAGLSVRARLTPPTPETDHE